MSTTFAKKKVSIIFPPTNVRIISNNDKEKRDRARTLSVKSLSTISESDSENPTRLELRKLRYSTLLGLPSGFTLEADPYSILNHSEWNDNVRVRSNCKSINAHGRNIRMNDAVPILSLRMSVLCLVANISFPGLGTFISAFSVLLCPRNAFMKEKRWQFFGWNIMIGVVQIIGVIYLLTGYFWGIIWGVYMVQLSDRGNPKGQSAPVLTKKVNCTLKNYSFWRKQKETNVEEDDIIENLTRDV